MRCLLAALMALVGSGGLPDACGAGPTWGRQVLADRSTWGYSPIYFGPWGNMVLLQDRYPLVVYLDRSSDPCLRSVTWDGGTMRNEPMFPVDFGTSAVRLAAHGDRAVAGWAVWNQSTGYTTIMCSMRIDGAWSAPEAVFTGYQVNWDLGMSAAGNPVIAGSVRSSYSSEIKWMTRQAGGWASEEVAGIPFLISNIALTLDAAGIPTVAWRAYTSGGPNEQVQYARKEAGTWTRHDVVGAGQLGTLFSGPSGEPCLIARASRFSPSFFLPLAGDETLPVLITGQVGDVTDAIAMPNGSIYATLNGFLIMRRDGVWSETQGLFSHVVRGDSKGTLHLLGMANGLLYYETQLPEEPPPLHMLTSYEDGSVIFDGVAIHPDGDPRIFAWTGDTLEYSPMGDSWVSRPVEDLSFGWLYAIDSTGRRHAFSGGGSYAVAGDDGVMETSGLPVSVTSFSGSSLYSFILDGADRPHVGFYTDLGSASVAVCYAVKHGDDWTVEAVTPGELSDQHCALALDPAGEPWMFTSRGLFRRSGAGWVAEYLASRATFPGLGFSSDGTVHAVFQFAGKLHSLTGKGGSYEVEVLDSYPVTAAVPGFAMAGDRPMLAYAQELGYSPRREAIVLAEKTGGYWRQRFITSSSTPDEIGSKLQLAVNDKGRWTLAGTLNRKQGSYTRAILFTCQGRLPEYDPMASPVLQGVTPQGGRCFQIDLESGPFREPMVLQCSASLDAWTPLLRIGPEFLVYPGDGKLVVRGDPFRAHVSYEVPAAVPAWFVRFASGSP